MVSRVEWRFGDSQGSTSCFQGGWQGINLVLAFQGVGKRSCEDLGHGTPKAIAHALRFALVVCFFNDGSLYYRSRGPGGSWTPKRRRRVPPSSEELRISRRRLEFEAFRVFLGAETPRSQYTGLRFLTSIVMQAEAPCLDFQVLRGTAHCGRVRVLRNTVRIPVVLLDCLRKR